jgi:hypothetical protein
MSATADMLLASFQALPEDEKHRVASEILRWSALADHPPLEDDDLAAAAEVVFLELDADERGRG